MKSSFSPRHSIMIDDATPSKQGRLKKIIPETGLDTDPPSVTVDEELKKDKTVSYFVYITGYIMKRTAKKTITMKLNSPKIFKSNKGNL